MQHLKSLPILIAWRNLTHDRARFIVTIVGIAFSVILVGMQMGLLLGFISTTSTIALNSKADIIIAAAGVKSVDISTPQNERRRFQALSVKGVKKAESMILDFSQFKRPDGVAEVITLVGILPNATMGLPWNLDKDIDLRKALSYPDAVMIDNLYKNKLGISNVNQVAEINNVRVRVVGFTNQIRTFTQSPFVFTSLDNARKIVGLGDRHISYVFIKAQEDSDLKDLTSRLQKHMPDTKVITAKDFANSSAKYWLFTTGAGISLIMSSSLGLLVAGVIAAQTLYASTMDRLSEYATIRAIGGSSKYLYKIVLIQASIAGFIGYFIGIIIVSYIAYQSKNSNAAPLVPISLIVSIFIATILDCLIAAIVSLRIVTKIDPVKVFK